MKTSVDATIIGAGGAGMMCALTAARRGKRVLLVDHSNTIGKKILISGGGRCNFTNIFTTAESYVCQNPHFVKSSLAGFKPNQFIELVEKHKIPYHEKKLGQLFCDRSAQDIVDMLVSECESAGAEFWLDCEVRNIMAPSERELPEFRARNAQGSFDAKSQAQPGQFVINTSRGLINSKSLVIATGGLSVPKVGATAFGYDLAKQFGLKIVETAPALDGFVFNEKDLIRFKELQGISADSIVTCNGASFRENILFTHRGLSGPASLQASLYWKQGSQIAIDLCPDFDVMEKLVSERSEKSKRNIRNILADYLPQRLAQRICQEENLDDSIQHISDKALQALADRLGDFVLKPSSTVGYIKAEVTRGGVDTRHLSSTTMECKNIPNLYFIGEVVDVTGQLGGYNFQWAWASGFAAGKSVG